MKLFTKHLFALMAMCVVTELQATEYKSQGITLDTVSSKNPQKFRVLQATNLSAPEVTLYFVHGGDLTKKTLARGGAFKGDLTCNAVFAEFDKGKLVEILVKGEKVNPPVVQTPSDSLPDNTGNKTMQLVLADFWKYLEDVPFYSETKLKEDSDAVNERIDNLKNRTDKEEYMQRQSAYVAAQLDSLRQYETQDSLLCANFWKKHHRKYNLDKAVCMDSIKVVLEGKRMRREGNLERLQRAMEDLSKPEKAGVNVDINWKFIANCVALLLLFVALFWWYRRATRRQTNEKSNTALPTLPVSTGAPAIEVLNTRPTTLKKLSLDDVVGNDAYLKIESREFCENSAVRTLYLKNSCIKDIYNMYAEDLRNPENPKEDGCMVLGRWVKDDVSGLYDVSLEYIVMPGNDAVFSEYELNFGGKIKLKMSERLRRLRRETGLQYDLTCWVHSHPGLGVFFSSSDNNVHMQHDHSSHPGALTAIVVDILTPDQEMGIFTFRDNQSINSKSDLKRLYSLEELYKWAVESERSTLKAEDYFNLLSGVKLHVDECFGIELSNSAVIDMAALAVEQKNGFVGMVHGYQIQRGVRTELIVGKVSKNLVELGDDLLGCFVIAPHCSIPSVRKAMATLLNKIRFVLVYTPVDDLLTAIPVVKQDLLSDEDNYGERKLEDLKIWTRRKR